MRPVKPMGQFYFDRGVFSEKPTKWVSFESTPNLESTKRDIYGRCVPCITNLYEQLKEGKKEIRLGPAFTCWKVVAVVDDEAQAVKILEEFEKRFLGDRKLKGRFGSGDASKTTRVIVFNAKDDKEKDRLAAEVKQCAAAVSDHCEVFCHKGCGELYHELLGDWRNWHETESIKKVEVIEPLLEKIRRILYWEDHSQKDGGLPRVPPEKGSSRS